MEFIKAFLLFVFFVLIMGLVLAILVYIVYILITTLILLVKNFKNFLLFILRNQDWTPKGLFKTLKGQFLSYINFLKTLKPTKKHIVIYAVIFILSSIYFYVSRVNTYLLSDRPYKEAKAYAIAGEYLQLYQVAIGSFKTADTFYYKALQYLQREFTLKNIYRLIPENDAEREIWNYKFQQYIYARSFWAPVVEDNIRKNFGLLHVFASFEPEIKILINNVYNSIINLDTLPIKDEQFSKIDRYLVIASMAPYYEKYAAYEINPNYEAKDGIKTKGSKNYVLSTDSYYINKFNNFLQAVDNTKYQMDNDKELSNAFNDNPTIKALLYWAGVRGYAGENSADIYIYSIYPCNTTNMDKYVEYQGDFLDWTNEPNCSFKKLSKNTQDTYKFIINAPYLHYTAKYICNKKFNSYSKEEDGAIYRGNKNIEKEMHRIMSDKDLPKLVKQLKSKLENNNTTKGAENGTR